MLNIVNLVDQNFKSLFKRIVIVQIMCIINRKNNYINLVDQNFKSLFKSVTKPLARLLEPLRIATILNIYLSNGM